MKTIVVENSYISIGDFNIKSSQRAVKLYNYIKYLISRLDDNFNFVTSSGEKLNFEDFNKVLFSDPYKNYIDQNIIKNSFFSFLNKELKEFCSKISSYDNFYHKISKKLDIDNIYIEELEKKITNKKISEMTKRNLLFSLIVNINEN